MYEPCSMESTPASTANGSLPAVRVRGDASAESVRVGHEGAHLFLGVLRALGSSPLDSTPPVAQNLMTSAPYLMTSRKRRCTPATPSATPSASLMVFERERFSSQ